jgi:hypothetical protein
MTVDVRRPNVSLLFFCTVADMPKTGAHAQSVDRAGVEVTKLSANKRHLPLQTRSRQDTCLGAPARSRHNSMRSRMNEEEDTCMSGTHTTQQQLLERDRRGRR